MKYIYMYNHIFIIHLTHLDRLLGCFHINYEYAMNIGVHDSSQISGFVFLDIYPGVELLDHVAVLFWRILHTVLHRDCTSLHAHLQGARVLFSLHPHQHFLFVDFLMAVVLTGVS